MENRNLYLFIASAVLLLVGISGWAGHDQFSDPPRWAYATIALGIVCFIYTVWISRSELQGGMRLRSTRTGIQVALMVIVVTAILVIVELVSVKHFKRWDVTPGNFYSLSAKTMNLLNKLDREKRRIEIIAFTRKLEEPAITEILDQYSRASKQVSFRFLNLDASPRTAKKYEVDAYGTLVVIYHFNKEEIEKQKKSKSADKEKKKTFRSEKIFELSENAIANAILKTIQTEQKRVYYLTGHGERLFSGQGREAMKALAIGMRDDNYQVDELLLLRKKGVPENTSMLIIAAPQKELEEVEVEYIDNYIKTGGRLLVFLEPDMKPGRLTALLERYGFKLPTSFVIDPESVRFELAGGNIITPFAVNYGLHDITKQLKGLATVFPTVRHVSATGMPKAGLHSEDLIKTGPGSFTVENVSLQNGQLAFDPKTRKEGPIPIGAAVSVTLDLYKLAQGQSPQSDTKPATSEKNTNEKNEARIVVFGDADFASDAFIGAQGNANLIFNTVNWLGGEKDLITIRPKSRTGEPLVLAGGEGRFVHLFTVWIMPLFIILIGAAVYVRRRQLR
ncbi:MAG: GldG family protein [Nitrospinae bacterium]|nr:GldG family protein [Nitrospinota bacterium]